MKTKQVKVLLSAAVVLLMAWAFASCSKKDDGPAAVSKTVLNDSINVATALVANTTEGTQDGQYTAGSKTTLNAAITAATLVATTTTVTQAMVDASVVSLHAAMDIYRAAIIEPVAAANLVAHWAFDEGTGTTAADESTNHFTGTFKAGFASMGSVSPVWTADHKGNANKAIQFNKGASVEVPYNTKLNPGTLTLAAWVRVDTINSGNRFIGLSSWLGYKFQLQEDNRPFGTVQTEQGDWDRNAGVAIPVSEWHHLAFTFTDGHMYFYIDGEITPLLNDDAPGTGVLTSPALNLVLGADYPNDKYCTCNGDNFGDANSPEYHVIPAAWGGHLRGALDEVRIYNIALSDAQILSIYNREK